jgi:ferritin-like metal-binding protein YciE
MGSARTERHDHLHQAGLAGSRAHWSSSRIHRTPVRRRGSPAVFSASSGVLAGTERNPRKGDRVSLRDVLEEQVEDLYSAEQQLVEALPKVARAVHNDELRRAIDEHLEETRGHVTRLEEVRAQLGIGSSSTHCKGMEGLIAESNEIVGMSGDPLAKDAALIAGAQRIEHYEIAGYGTRAHARGRARLGRSTRPPRPDTRRGGERGQTADEDRNRRHVPRRH